MSEVPLRNKNCCTNNNVKCAMHSTIVWSNCYFFGNRTKSIYLNEHCNLMRQSVFSFHLIWIHIIPVKVNFRPIFLLTKKNIVRLWFLSKTFSIWFITTKSTCTQNAARRWPLVSSVSQSLLFEPNFKTLFKIRQWTKQLCYFKSLRTQFCFMFSREIISAIRWISFFWPHPAISIAFII